MKILNEFDYQTSEEEIKKLIIQDLSAKIGWIKSNYPNKMDSETNLAIIFRHLAFENIKECHKDYVWDNDKEIYTELVKLLPISKYFFGRTFPTIIWYYYPSSIGYTLVV